MLPWANAPGVAATAELGTDSESGLLLEHRRQPVVASLNPPGRRVEHREFHAAGDVDADGVGNDGVLGGEHPADREAVTDVGVGHECSGDRHWQAGRGRYLGDGGVFDLIPPLPPGHGSGPRFDARV
jgi:hypothetical protein